MTEGTRPELRLLKPEDPGKKKEKRRIKLTRKAKKRILIAGLVALAIIVVYLLLSMHSYDTVYKGSSYKRQTSDTNRYEAFQKGIVCYSRDGVTFLNRKNKEQWIQPAQFQNPVIDVCGKSFAVGDVGGNLIQVFDAGGLKGEFETTLPIEKFSVSSQGIVSAILKNDLTPSIVTYDAVGNILVENKVTAGTIGYPAALEMSPDGMTLMVSYLDMNSTALKSKVVCYNFGTAGKKKDNHQVGSEEYTDQVIPELFYFDDNTAAAVGDSSLILYSGGDTPKKTKEVKITQEIRSVFHTDRYVGFLLLNQKKSGYEVRLYDKKGKQVMNHEVSGAYSNIKMAGSQIIMYDGSKCCILTKGGIVRYQGDLGMDALNIFPVWGINRYGVINANELRIIYLLK